MATAVVCTLGALLIVAATANAAVLYDQYNNFGAANGTASSDPAGPDNATQLADDFVVPAGLTWTIDGVDVRANTVNPTSFNVFVYSNGSGVPGALLASRTGLAYTGAQPDRSVTVAPPISLAPGIYWVSPQADTNGWGWVSRTVVTGSPTAFKTENGGACDPNFMPTTVCGGGLPEDAAFRLNGTVTQIPPPAVALPVVMAPPPAKKKCKKRKAKASAKKKKCRKKRRGK